MKITDEEFKQLLQENDISNLIKCGTIDLIMNPQTNSYYYQPQSRYVKRDLPLISYRGEDGMQTISKNDSFCKFRLNDLPRKSGVYFWVLQETEEIIYIGETANLYKRFNSGYGLISPRNCYQGGQATNIKMNRAVISYYQEKKHINIYYFVTDEHKEVERNLLESITTQYNNRNNIR